MKKQLFDLMYKTRFCKDKFLTLFVSSIAVFSVLCVPSKTQAACTATTIAHTYGFHFEGFAGPATSVPLKVSGFFPIATVGEISFTETSDSGGTFTGSESANAGGVGFSGFATTFSGHYTVNAPQCTGTENVTFADGGTVSVDFVIVDGGQEIDLVLTTSGLVQSGIAKEE
jgi:hypothetical protein